MNLKSLKITWVLAIAILSLAGCEEDEKANVSPIAPTLSSPANGSTIAVTSTALSWSASTDADGDDVTYDVYFGTEEELTTAVASDISSTTYTAESLLDQTTYYWKVAAKDNKGGSTFSEVGNFTTNIIVGSWLSDEYQHPQLGPAINTYLFNADGTGQVDIDSQYALSFEITWEAADQSVTITAAGTPTTYYYSFEDNGDTMLFKESASATEVAETYHRIVE